MKTKLNKGKTQNDSFFVTENERKKAVDELANWLNTSEVSFSNSDKMYQECPILIKILGI